MQAAHDASVSLCWVTASVREDKYLYGASPSNSTCLPGKEQGFPTTVSSAPTKTTWPERMAACTSSSSLACSNICARISCMDLSARTWCLDLSAIPGEHKNPAPAGRSKLRNSSGPPGGGDGRAFLSGPTCWSDCFALFAELAGSFTGKRCFTHASEQAGLWMHLVALCSRASAFFLSSLIALEGIAGAEGMFDFMPLSACLLSHF
jgi:hypothetical protein